MTASDEERPEVLEAIRTRMFGTGSGHTSQEALQEYIRKHANSSEDIVSFHARWLASQLANSDMMASVAHRFLAMCIERNDQIASDERALRRLTDELAKHAKRLVEHAWADDEPVRQVRLNGCRMTGMQENPDGTVTLNFGSNETVVHSLAILPSEEDGMLRPDARLASYVEKLGSNGAACADRIRLKARVRWANAQNKRSEQVKDEGTVELWELWLNPDDIAWPLWAQALAQTIWLDVVKPRLEKERAKPPALVMAVAEPVAHIMSRAHRGEERNGQIALRLPGEVIVRVANSAAAIGADTINALMVDRGLKLFGSVPSHKVLRSVIFTGHKQALESNPDPRVIRIPGGYSAFTHDVLGLNGQKAVNQVRDIIEAMHATELPLPPHNTYTRLLIREVSPAVGRRQGWLKLILGTFLLPDYVHELQQTMAHTLTGRRAMRLVPVTEMPPFVGHEFHHGAQATFSMLLVAYMRDCGREIIEHGGVRLDEENLVRLAKDAGLDPRLIPQVMDRWCQDGDDGSAFLKKIAPDRFTLGDAHAIQRAFIEQGAQRELDGATAGQKSAAKQTAKVRRLARKARS